MKKYIVLILISFATLSVHSQIHSVTNLNISNDRGVTLSWNYGFGVSHLATDGVDKELGEYDLPPAPPEGLYVYFEYIYNRDGMDEIISTNMDIKALPEEEHFYIKHKLNIKWGFSKEVYIKWNNLAFSEHVDSVFIKDALNGQFIKADMKQKDSLLLRNNAFTVFYIHVYYSKNPASIIEDDEKISDYKVFPNPVVDILSLGKKDFKDLIVYSIDGRVIARFTGYEVISVNNLPRGLYFYLIDGIHYGKFIKQ
jgi:hypothetical protein